jgi:hypothetical protein
VSRAMASQQAWSSHLLLATISAVAADGSLVVLGRCDGRGVGPGVAGATVGSKEGGSLCSSVGGVLGGADGEAVTVSEGVAAAVGIAPVVAAVVVDAAVTAPASSRAAAVTVLPSGEEETSLSPCGAGGTDTGIAVGGSSVADSGALGA